METGPWCEVAEELSDPLLERSLKAVYKYGGEKWGRGAEGGRGRALRGLKGIRALYVCAGGHIFCIQAGKYLSGCWPSIFTDPPGCRPPTFEEKLDKRFNKLLDFILAKGEWELGRVFSSGM